MKLRGKGGSSLEGGTGCILVFASEEFFAMPETLQDARSPGRPIMGSRVLSYQSAVLPFSR
jgi:hypothetical protein